MIDWLILTGGAASRLGQDKASTQVAGRTLLEHVRAAIALADPGGRVIEVGPEASGGPAAAVVAALGECRAEWVGVIAVDMPFAGAVLSALVGSVRTSVEHGWDVCLPVDGDGRRQWLCALYRRSALAAAAADEQWRDRAFHRLVAGLSVQELVIDESTSLIDIDTPDDLRNAESLASGPGEVGTDG